MTDSARTKPTRPRPLSSVSAWDLSTDVAVVGFGGAGACAAIEAHDAGADVTVFELASAGGGSTELSSAEMYLGGSGGTRVQRACGFEDSTEDMVEYLMMAGGPQADEAKVRAYAEGAAAHFDWLVWLGVPYKDSFHDERAIVTLTDDCLMYTSSEQCWPFRDRAKPCPRGHSLQVEGDNGGPLLVKILTGQVEQRGIPVHYDTRALTLIADESGAIRGLVVRRDGREVNVEARRGVVLCAGGFVMNEDMVREYAPALLRANNPIGNPGDTGGGILMGMGAGGAAINMHEGFVTLPFYPPSSLTYGILINRQAQRFINEDCYHGRVGSFTLDQLGDRIYLVCSADDYDRPDYLNADIAGTGETIEELAGELGVDAGLLRTTIETYNEHAAHGGDPVWHKHPQWLKPLEPPFAALDCTPGRGAFYPYFTLGGLDTLPTGEVLTPLRETVAGLYAAGRTACGIPRRGAGYGSGMSVGDATFFGRMAGLQAARTPGRD